MRCTFYSQAGFSPKLIVETPNEDLAWARVFISVKDNNAERGIFLDQEQVDRLVQVLEGHAIETPPTKWTYEE